MMEAISAFFVGMALVAIMGFVLSAFLNRKDKAKAEAEKQRERAAQEGYDRMIERQRLRAVEQAAEKLTRASEEAKARKLLADAGAIGDVLLDRVVAGIKTFDKGDCPFLEFDPHGLLEDLRRKHPECFKAQDSWAVVMTLQPHTPAEMHGNLPPMRARNPKWLSVHLGPGRSISVEARGDTTKEQLERLALSLKTCVQRWPEDVAAKLEVR